MDWQIVETVIFNAFKVASGAVVVALCMDRAMKMDGRARRKAVWIYIGMALGGAGIMLSPMMELWLARFFYAMFFTATMTLLLDGQKRWKSGMPDEVWKTEETWPAKDRRNGNGRREKDYPEPSKP